MKKEREISGDANLMFHRLLHFGFTFGDFTRLENRPPKFQEFSMELAQLAAKYEQKGKNAESAELKQSACHFFDLASRYYHFAQLFIPAVRVKEQFRGKSRANFREMAKNAPAKIEFMQIKYGEHRIPAYIHKFHDDAPTVIFINGLDSSKEVELSTFARHFYMRGMNVVAFDGPGQGEIRKSCPMQRTNHQEAVSVLVDYLINEKGINEDKLGVFGVSFGGYLAPRAAAHDKRFKACISLSGPYSYDLLYVPPIVLADMKEQYNLPEANSMEDFKSLISLNDIEGKLLCPSYIVIGEADHLLKETEKDKLENFPAGEKKVLRIPGAEHVCSSHHAEILPELADWMLKKLK